MSFHSIERMGDTDKIYYVAVVDKDGNLQSGGKFTNNSPVDINDTESIQLKEGNTVEDIVKKFFNQNGGHDGDDERSFQLHTLLDELGENRSTPPNHTPPNQGTLESFINPEGVGGRRKRRTSKKRSSRKVRRSRSRKSRSRKGRR